MQNLRVIGEGEFGEKKPVKEGMTFGSGHDTFHVDAGKNVTANHAKIRLEGNDWVLCAREGGYEIGVDNNTEVVRQLKLSESVEFWIGNNKFSVESDTDAIPPKVRPNVRKPRRPLKAPEDIPTLQNFFPHDPLYRVAVMGSKDAGKTTLMAALDLAKFQKPNGVKIERVNELQQEDGKSLSENDKKAYAEFQKGNGLLDGARDRLDSGKFPKSTPLEIGDVRHVFDVQTNRRQKPGVHIETIDYAGEHIRPALFSNDEEKAAKRIRDIFSLAHALIILVPYPLPGYGPETEIEELYRIRDSFKMLTWSDHPVPVVLLLNKWDRYEDFDATKLLSPRARQKQIKQFLKADNECSNAVKALRDTIAMQTGAANVQIMCASAVGKCRLEDGGELPDPQHKGAFGLVEPMLWLVKRADRQEVAAYSSKVSRIPWRLSAHLRNWFSNESRAAAQFSDVRDVAYNLHRRRMPELGLRLRTCISSMRFRFRQLVAVMQILAIALMFALAAEWQWSSKPIREAYSTVKKPFEITSPIDDDGVERIMTAVDDRMKQEAVLSGYTHTYRHWLQQLTLPKTSATNIFQRIQHSLRLLPKDNAMDVIRASVADRRSSLLNALQDSTVSWSNRHVLSEYLLIEFPSETNSVVQFSADYQKHLEKQITSTTFAAKDRKLALETFRSEFDEVQGIAGKDMDTWDMEINNAIKAEQDARVADEVRDKIIGTLEKDDFAAMVNKLLRVDTDVAPEEKTNVIVQVESRLPGKLITYVNQCVKDAKMENGLGVLSRCRDELSSKSDFAGIRDRLAKAINMLTVSQKDYDLYEKLRNASTGQDFYAAADAYLNATKNKEIPGFMSSKATHAQNQPLSGRFKINPKFKNDIKNGKILLHKGKEKQELMLAKGKPKDFDIDVDAIPRRGMIPLEMEVQLETGFFNKPRVTRLTYDDDPQFSVETNFDPVKPTSLKLEHKWTKTRKTLDPLNVEMKLDKLYAPSERPPRWNEEKLGYKSLDDWELHK